MSWIHFGDSRIACGDVDGLFAVERRKHFLYIETKGPQEIVPTGQRILLQELSTVAGFCVCVLRGPKGQPESIQFVIRGGWYEPQPITRHGFQGFIDLWYDAANTGKREIEFDCGALIDERGEY